MRQRLLAYSRIDSNVWTDGTSAQEGTHKKDCIRDDTRSSSSERPHPRYPRREQLSRQSNISSILRAFVAGGWASSSTSDRSCVSWNTTRDPMEATVVLAQHLGMARQKKSCVSCQKLAIVRVLLSIQNEIFAKGSSS